MSLQPVRVLQTSMDAGEALMFCKTCWSKDSVKSIEMQNLDQEAQEYRYYSTQEYSNDKDYKEEERRRKIGLANKGRVPWNKGRKHSAGNSSKIQINFFGFNLYASNHTQSFKICIMQRHV